MTKSQIFRNMKLTATNLFSIALLASNATNVLALPGCYGFDSQWGEGDQAEFHTRRACEGYDGKMGAFQGVFRPGEKKSACVNDGSGNRFNMEVRNENTKASLNLGDKDCTKEFKSIIDNCGYGFAGDEL